MHIKDLANALDTGQHLGVPLILTSKVMEMLQSLKMDGLGQRDHSALLNFYERLAEIEVHS